MNGLLQLLGGPLEVVLISGFVSAAGQHFDVLDWTTLEGSFGDVMLPGLAPGLVWDSSKLYVDGSLAVAAVPEPGESLMLLAGLGIIGVIVRRRGGRRVSRPDPA